MCNKLLVALLGKNEGISGTFGVNALGNLSICAICMIVVPQISRNWNLLVSYCKFNTVVPLAFLHTLLSLSKRVLMTKFYIKKFHFMRTYFRNAANPLLVLERFFLRLLK